MPSLRNLTKQSTVAEQDAPRDEFEKLNMEPYPIENDENSTNQPKLLDKDKLILVYYFNFGDKGINTGYDICTKIKEMLDNTQFLENIDSTFLLNQNHYRFYPHTSFKFLNRDELKKVIINKDKNSKQ